jgi:predicted Zn finger-like uncharacterized protein
MILTCPNCGTQYVVKDDAIPPEGRQVRCAACKHSWHQDPLPHAVIEDAPAAEHEPLAEPESAAEAAPAEDVQAPAEEEGVAESTMIEPRSGPEAEERAYEEAVIEGGTDLPAAETAPVQAQPAETEPETAQARPATEDWNEPPHAEAAQDMFTPFAASDEVEPRRRRPLVAILIVALIIIVAAAAFWFYAPPELKARLGLSAAGATPLQLVKTNMVLQQLESGNQLLTISGRVINPTNKEQEVPPLQARLNNAQGKMIYSWTIAPPVRSLPAGGSTSFNSAEVNVPPGGQTIKIVLAPSGTQAL